MPYARPTLSTLIQQAQQDISSSPLGLNGFLSRSVLKVLAVVQAGFAYLHYDYQDYIAKQAVPWTATDEYLEGWAALKRVNRKAATFAVLVATFSGTEGYPLPVGASATLPSGAQYVCIGGGAVTNGFVVGTFQAVAPGSASTATIGSQLILGGVTGINATSGSVTALTAGSDIETDDSLRTRMLTEYALPPQGGSAADYIEWALAVPGVTRAWVAPLGNGSGTVIVYVMFDQAEVANSGFPVGSNGVAAPETRDMPASGDQLVVANAIYPKRPVAALVYAYGPTPAPVNFAITGLGSLATSTTQAAIKVALDEMFLRRGYVGGTIDPTTGAVWTAIDPSDWYAAIASVVGNVPFVVATPSGPVAPSNGALNVTGTVAVGT